MSSTQSPLGPPSLPDTSSQLLVDEHASACESAEHGGPIEAGRGAPPPELIAEMARADAARAQLAAGGELVRFRGGDGEALRIELCELDGTPLRALSLAEAIALAAPEAE